MTKLLNYWMNWRLRFVGYEWFPIQDPVNVKHRWIWQLHSLLRPIMGTMSPQSALGVFHFSLPAARYCWCVQSTLKAGWLFTPNAKGITAVRVWETCSSSCKCNCKLWTWIVNLSYDYYQFSFSFFMLVFHNAISTLHIVQLSYHVQRHSRRFRRFETVALGKDDRTKPCLLQSSCAHLFLVSSSSWF